MGASLSHIEEGGGHGGLLEDAGSRLGVASCAACDITLCYQRRDSELTRPVVISAPESSRHQADGLNACPRVSARRGVRMQSTNDDGQRAQNSDGSRGLLEVGEADEPFATLVASQDFQPLATLVASQDHVHEKYCVPSRSYASQQLVPAPAASTSLAFSLPESVFDPPTLTAVYEERPRRLAGLTPRNHYAEPCRQPSSLPETMTALQRYRQRRYEQQPRDRQGQQQHALSGVQERVSELARDSVIGAHTATEESLSSSEARELPTLHSLTDSTSYEESKARHRSVFNRLPSLEELKNRHLVSHYESHLVQSAHTEDNRPPSSRQVGTDATARDAFAAQILFTSSPITPRRDKGQAVAVQASALARYRQRKMLQGGAKSST